MIVLHFDEILFNSIIELIAKVIQAVLPVLLIVISYKLGMDYYTIKKNDEINSNDKKKTAVIHSIDGHYGEGGGQVLRISAALGCLLKKSIIVKNIRGGRRVPGLARQHISGIDTLVRMSGSTTTGVTLKSCEMSINSAKQKSNLAKDLTKEFRTDVLSAGSVTLVFQAVLPYMLFRFVPTVLTVTGGTDVDFSPQIDYFRYVFLPILEETGARLACNVVQRGWNPIGGGKVHLYCEPLYGPLQAIQLEDRGVIKSIHTYIVLEGPEIWKQEFRTKLKDKAKTKVQQWLDENEYNINTGYNYHSVPNALTCGVSILFVLDTTSGVILANGGVSNVRLPKKDVDKVDLDLKYDKIINWLVNHFDSVVDDYKSGTCVDKHMQDQLIIFMALAQGVSNVVTKGPLTEHTTTAIHFAEKLTGAKFTATPLDGLVRLECKGIGYQRD